MAKAPFTEQHRETLEKALSDVREARDLMEHAEACGVDCQHDREIADYLENGLTEYKKRFFTAGKQIGI